MRNFKGVSGLFGGLHAGVALSGLAVVAICQPGAAWAQAAKTSAADDEATDNKEIIVTGTLIRGVAPVGTNVVSVSADDVKQSGATSTAQLLQTIPQLGVFSSLNFPPASGNTTTTNRPNLRNLPGFNTSGGSTTLILMDGHRIVGSGITTTTPDPDIIPPGAIERVEIVPDGGSAVYGSDAIAGVINFITRAKYDGVKVDAHAGFAKNYYQYDGNITAGKDWGSGGFYVSYNYSRHDEILGRDRDYIRQFPNDTGLFKGLTSTSCDLANVVPAGSTTVYGLPFTTATAATAKPNQCDNSDNATIYPAEYRHSVFASLTQDLAPWLTADIRAFATKRVINTHGDQFYVTSGSTVAATNAALAADFAAHRVGAETSQTLYYRFGSDRGTGQRLNLSTWGVSPTLTFKLGDNWRARLMGNYGQSVTENHVGAFNNTALTNAINAGLFNPYNIPASNPAALAIITNSETYGKANQEMENLRLIVDGGLFRLPGGEVKVAAGAEYDHESWKSRTGAIAPGTEISGIGAQSVGATLIAPAAGPANLVNLSRKVKSVFGEIIVPIFGADLSIPLFHELSVSASGRYDDYSDVGHTFNPKFGVTWKPVDWITLRGAYGKSFQAPSLADTTGADINTLFVIPAGFFPPGVGTLQANGTPYPQPTAGQITYVQRGIFPGIKPQTAKTLSFGFDVKPPFIPGLSFGATWHRIELKGRIGIPPGNNSVAVFRDYPQVVTLSPTDAFLAPIISNTQAFPFGGPCSATAPTTCSSIYAFVTIAKNNLGNYNQEGIDFNLKYNLPTSFGSLNLAFNGNLDTKRAQSASATSAFVDVLTNNASKFQSRTSVAAEVGNLTANAVWNYRSGYNLVPAIGFVPQTKISAYHVFDLYFAYEFKGEGIAKDLVLSLNVNNVFDQAPPESRAIVQTTPSNSGYENGGTFGRLFQIGISKKF